MDAKFDEELQDEAANAFYKFHRKVGERADTTISRFDAVRERASKYAGFQMSANMASRKLCEVMGVQGQQLWEALRPTNGLYPTTDAPAGGATKLQQVDVERIPGGR